VAAAVGEVTRAFHDAFRWRAGLPPLRRCPACGSARLYPVDEPLFRPTAGQATFGCRRCGKVANQPKQLEAGKPACLREAERRFRFFARGDAGLRHAEELTFSASAKRSAPPREDL